MNKDVTNLIKDSTSTFLNIAQMTQYRIKYVQGKDAKTKEKMYKHAFIAGVFKDIDINDSHITQ